MMNIIFTRGEIKTMCKFLRNTKNDIDEYSKEKIYNFYWKFYTELSKSKESEIQLTFADDEIGLMTSVLYYIPNKKSYDMFVKIAEELQIFHELNGYQYTPDGLIAIKY